ncbi:MAG TPA: penicillin-binding protein 2, partial [Phycisphaeraceae bacterium]
SQVSKRTVMGRRGTIYDRRGRVLATTRTAQRLFVDPYLIEERSTFSARVGYSLGYDPVWVEKTLFQHPRSRYIVLDHRLSPQRLEQFHQLNLPGLAVEPVLVRDYPHGTLAGQLLGFVNREGQGGEGVEMKFNARLRPKPGRLTYLRDAQGRPLWVRTDAYQPHEDGESIRLSIDITIQAIAQKYLAQTVQEYGAQSGQIIIMQPYTGEILAMANVPEFDPNHYNQSKPEDWRNRAVTDMFEPGSIFKPFIWAAATQMGVAKPEELIDCTTRGWWKPARGPILRDAHPNGLLTWEQVLIKSSNIGMGKVGERLGVQKLHQIITAFGFGRSTGSGLPGEVGGLVRSPENWSATDITRVTMGQGVAVTPLQMVRAFCAIANDGFLVTPMILAAQPDAAQAVPIQERVLLPSIAAYTRSVLGRVVVEGTGRKANSSLYALFGKTGTAQLPDLEHGGYLPDGYVSSFIAGAPLDAPQLVVGCFIHHPDKKKGHYGGIVAAPAVKQVMEESLMYLGVPPQTVPRQLPPPTQLVLDD